MHRKTEKFAVVAQLVEHWLPKPRVAGSSPVYRSKFSQQTTRLFSIIYAQIHSDSHRVNTNIYCTKNDLTKSFKLKNRQHLGIVRIPGDPSMRVTDFYIKRDWSHIDRANRRVLDYVAKYLKKMEESNKEI